MAKLRYRTRYVKDYWGVFDYHTNKRKPMCRCIDLNHAARIVRALNEYADRNEPWTNPIYAVKNPNPLSANPIYGVRCRPSAKHTRALPGCGRWN